MNLTEFLTRGKYLPKRLRDFHQQKDTFKLVDRVCRRYVEKQGGLPHVYGDVNWVDAQCYVIDVFLWVMAQHGYTLQKSRVKPVDGFKDLDDAIEQMKQEELQAIGSTPPSIHDLEES